MSPTTRQGTSTSKTLVVGSANTHSNPHALKYFKQHECKVIAVTEAYRYIYKPNILRGFDAYWGKNSADKRRGSKDNPILTHKSLVSVGEFAFKGSDPSRPIKIAPERWITGRVIKFNGRDIAIINIHPNAAVGNLPKTVDRVQKYDNFMQKLDTIIKTCKLFNYEVIVLGDVNFAKGMSSDGWDDPYEVFRDNNLFSHFQHIDAFAWSKGLSLSHYELVSPFTLQSDHPGFIIDFEV